MSIMRSSFCIVLVLASTAPAWAQRPGAPAASPAPAAATKADLPRDYVIGHDDVLDIRFWKEETLSREVTVRPDGKIALELLNEVQAAGKTPEQLREQLMTEARRFMEEPSVAVIVKQINSRRVYITGLVQKPGAYPLTASMTVLQLISLAGGLTEFAKGKEIVVMRTENGAPLAYPFNYEDIRKGRRLSQNVTLKPGDTVVVP
jgi:polysaccharide biosynthesis/export protein